MTRKLLLLFVISLLACLMINSDFFEERLLHKIFLTTVKKYLLGTEYIRKTNFKIASGEDQILEGESEKYVLVSDDGSKWIFKIPLSKVGSYTELMGYRLAELCGINVPEVFHFSMLINNEHKEGTLIEYIPIKIKFTNNDLLNFGVFPVLSEDQIYSLINSLIFDWFFFNRLFTGTEFIVSQSGKLYEIDFDLEVPFSCEQINKAIKEAQIYPDNSNWGRIRWKEFLEKNHTNIDFKQLIGIANHINRMDDCFIEKTVDTALKSHCIKPYILKALVDRRLGLISFFNDYYSKIFQKKINIRGSALIYRLMVYNKLRSKVYSYRKRLADMNNNSPTKNQNLSVIACGDAWRYIRFCHNESKKAGFIDLNKIKNKLLLMQKEKSDLNEKLGINLYIRQIEILAGVDLSTYGQCPFIPVVLNSNINAAEKVENALLNNLRYKEYRLLNNKQ